MTCRGLYRLEIREYECSLFHHYYSRRRNPEIYLPGPWDDQVLSPHWEKLWNYGVGNDASSYLFAFASIEQMEEYWGPVNQWPRGMLENLHDVLVLPDGVIDGETQSIFHRKKRLN